MTRHRTAPIARKAAASTSDPIEKAAIALAAIGPTTAAALAAHLGIAYSTITPRLRRLEADHRAERIREDVTGRTLWQTTPTDEVPSAPSGGGATAPSTSDRGTGPQQQATEGASTHARTSKTGADTAPTNPAPPQASVDDDAAGASPRPRRPKGSIAGDILGVMRRRPDDTFKVSQLAAALGGTSAGAIANALHKLVMDGSISQVADKPATYQAN